MVTDVLEPARLHSIMSSTICIHTYICTCNVCMYVHVCTLELVHRRQEPIWLQNRVGTTLSLPWGGERMSCAGKALTKKSTTSWRKSHYRIGVFYRPTYLYFPDRTVIEKWMEETTNPMMFMQSAFSEAAGVPNTLRSNHACLTLMPTPPQKTCNSNLHIHICTYMYLTIIYK